jgi:kynurenine formamidase
MGREAWGKWGEEDERGALNHIGAAEVKRAAGLVRQGKVISLAQPMSAQTPVPEHRAPMLHFMGRDGGDYAAGGKRPGGFQFAEDTIVLPLHFATHVDALCHAWYDDALYNGFPSTGIRSTTGASRCGIDKMGPIVGRGVLLDLVGLAGRTLGRGEAVTGDMLEHAAERAHVRIETGDVVLIRTGWAEDRFASPDYYDGEPGIDVGAARWLAERGVAGVGSDNFAIEPIPFPPEQVFPVHQCLIRDFGITLMEGLVLSSLSQAGAGTFLFMATPLPVCGGTGSPLVPLAVL